MNCVGVTCLSVVVPSGSLDVSPPYLAESSFQVPISLWSGFASAFGSAGQAVVAATASAIIIARRRVACVPPLSSFALGNFMDDICFVLSLLSGFGSAMMHFPL